MIRVLHVMPNWGIGGAERMAVHLLQGLDRSRFVAAAVGLYDPEGTDLEHILANTDVEVWYLGKRKGFDPRLYRRLDAVIRKFRPDVVHTHRYVLRYCLPLLYWHNRRAIHTVHSVAEKEVGWTGRCVHRLAFGHRVLPVAIANEVEASIERVYGIRGVPLVPNGIPVATYAATKEAREDLRLRERVPLDVPVVLSIGRLAMPKNHALLLKAFAYGPAQRTQAQLWIVGDGELRESLEVQVRTLNLGDRVRFLGIRTDIAALLAASDVFALSSSWEGNPLSVMEAMAAGKPVVATNVGGVPELVESGTQGILVPPGDVSALGKALTQLVVDSDARRRMGNAAQERARERFDVSFMIRRYEDLYHQVYERSRG